MTHLRIEQNNIQENVSSAVIKKLYELATSGDLDQSSNLAGNIHTTGTYQEYIDVLCKTQQNPNGMFPDLTISYNKLYYKFNDPVFQQVCAQNWGDGVGITQSEFANITDTNNYNWIPTQILNNTSIKDLTELQYFTNIKGNDEGNGFSWKTHFNNMTSLEKVVLPSTITMLSGRYGGEMFINQTNLKYVDLGGIKICRYLFGGNFPNLETIIIPEGCEEVDFTFRETSQNTKITSITFPSTLKTVSALGWTLITSLTIPGTLQVLWSMHNNHYLQNVVFEDSNVPLTIYGSWGGLGGIFSYSQISTLIFPDRPITFDNNGGNNYFIGKMRYLTTLVFKRKPVSIDWSYFHIQTIPGYGSEHFNEVTDIYFPDADYNDMVADFQAANSNYSLVTFHKLSDYPGQLNQS